MNKTIVALNQISPEDTTVLSPTVAVWKNYLEQNHFIAKVTYWELKLKELQHSFVWNNISNMSYDDENSLLLFFNYLAWKEKDKKACVNIKTRLMGLKPNHITSDIAFFNKHMAVYAEKLDEVIDEYIKQTYSDEVVCFMFFINKKYKWICASLVAEKIKQQYPESIIVVGGIDSKRQSTDFLRDFKCFDFAIWGESEKTMLDLCNCLIEENKGYEDIPCLTFRRDDSIITSSSREKGDISFVDNALRPDYSDYWEQKKDIEVASATVPVIGIEIKKGNNYKPVQAIVNEILYFINEHQAYAFYFSGYEGTEEDRPEFEQLLDELILIKDQYPDFTISLFPVVARAIFPETLRKMMMAGFYSIQMDYISPSENLLKKYGAKSSFASNLLLIKFTSLYNVILPETDVIMGISGEEDDDILQAVSNLYYLRFFFKSGQLRHRLKKLEVTRYDTYCKRIRSDRQKWDINPSLKRFLPYTYLDTDSKKASVLTLMPVQSNPLWNDFKQAESYFIQNKFEYKLYRKANNTVLYKELFNDNVVNEFELDEMDWFILEKANLQVVSIDYLLAEITDKMGKVFLDVQIINTLENLKFERLLYLSNDYKEIVSIINTELII